VLHAATLPTDAIVLDPMNGSGTTTVEAQKHGLLALGVDLNPVMAVLARAKDASLAGRENDMTEIVEAVSGHAAGQRSTYEPKDEEALWFSPALYTDLKRIETAIDAVPSAAPAAEGRLSSVLRKTADPGAGLKDLLRAALLVTVRRCSQPRGSRNPTWFTPSVRDHTANESVVETFSQIAKDLMRDLTDAFRGNLFERVSEPGELPRRQLVLEADARELPVYDSVADLIVTSPPYLTRIDYAVTTAPELVFLGYGTKELFFGIRSSIMGSTCIVPRSHEVRDTWGEACLATIEQVRSHSSKASATYYFKTFVQYFQDAEALIRECLRVLKPSHSAYLVVQDSWYKDVHVPLGRIYSEIAEVLGAVSAEIVSDEDVKSHLGLVNAGARRYKKGAISEQVVRFEKRGVHSPIPKL
jgi:SAM-dependent methyltransferase